MKSRYAELGLIGLLSIFIFNMAFAEELPEGFNEAKPEAAVEEPAQKADKAEAAKEDEAQNEQQIKQNAEELKEAEPAQNPVNTLNPKVQPITAAVMYIGFSGFPKGEDPTDTNAIIIKSINATGHQVVTDEEIQAFFASEQGENYEDCLSISCTAEAGKVLGVQKVFSGNISKAQDKYKVNLVVVSTESGQVEAKYRSTIPLDGSLQNEIQSGTYTLIKEIEKPAPIVVDENNEEFQKAKEERFYKGELTTIGPLEIIPRNDRAGVIIGYRRLGFNHYAHIEPQVDLRFYPDDITKESKLRMGFGVPFNLQIFSGEDQNGDQEIDKFHIKLRDEDWDNWRDYAKIIRYIQYGRKEDNLYVNINRTFATSIGHGTVINRYIPNLDYFTTRVSGEIDAYGRYGGVELYVNDITKANVTGVLAFLKPASFFSEHWMAESLSFGFHYSMDWDAPYHIYSRPNDDGSYRYNSTDIHFFGADVELKVVKWPVEKPNVDVKVYLDYTKWLDNGSGISVGALGRFNLYTRIRQAFRVRLEFRAYQDNYVPAYFDSFYEVMKYKWISEKKPPLTENGNNVNLKPKLVEYSTRPGDWNHFGSYAEFSYALLDYIGVTLAVNRESGDDTGNFLFHIEIPATKYFQISASYYKANFTSFKNIFDASAENTMLIALARLRPVQILSFRFGVMKTIQPSTIFYPNPDSIWDIKADLDLSWEF